MELKSENWPHNLEIKDLEFFIHKSQNHSHNYSY